MEFKLGGNPIHYNDITDGIKWMQDSFLEKVRCLGPCYSWNNRQIGGDRVYSKLYWVFCNEAWGDAYNDCFTSYHEDAQYDLSYLLLKCVCPDERGIKPFRIFNMWCDHPSYMGMVKSVWESQCHLSPILKLASNLTRLKIVLKKV